MKTEKPNRRVQHKSFLFLVGLLVIILSLVTGTILGGVAGYFVAREVEVNANASPTETALQLVAASTTLDSDPAVVTASSLPVEQDPLPSVIEETRSVQAVNKVLPAVVTVISQGLRGTGTGSGFFINPEGYVVTNNHVVAGAQNVSIVYAKGGAAPAKIVGTAPDFDLAVLLVDGPVAGVAEWGDSGDLPLGAGVIAIGSALGRYQNTVTAGILSGFNRELGGLRGLLQTDAAINSGNSGGPLINLAGQVIGINAMTVRGGFSGAEGLGFAIPSNIARTVVRHLIETGQVSQPFLGIQYQELNPQVASDEDLTISEGALLQEVVVGTPANRAGLQVGDIIVAINGKRVDDRHPLVSLLLEHVAGDTINLEILRDGETMGANLILGERA